MLTRMSHPVSPAAAARGDGSHTGAAASRHKRLLGTMTLTWALSSIVLAPAIAATHAAPANSQGAAVANAGVAVDNRAEPVSAISLPQAVPTPGVATVTETVTVTVTVTQSVTVTETKTDTVTKTGTVTKTDTETVTRNGQGKAKDRTVTVTRTVGSSTPTEPAPESTNAPLVLSSEATISAGSGQDDDNAAGTGSDPAEGMPVAAKVGIVATLAAAAVLGAVGVARTVDRVRSSRSKTLDEPDMGSFRY